MFCLFCDYWIKPETMAENTGNSAPATQIQHENTWDNKKKARKPLMFGLVGK